MGLKPHRAIDLGTLTIGSGQTESDVMDFTKWRGAVHGIAIAPPGTLTGDVKVQVSEDNSTWLDKQSGGADITVPADGHVSVRVMDFKYLRLVSSSAEGADREFIIKGVEEE